MPPAADGSRRTGEPPRTVASLGEFALIDRLRRLVPAGGPGVLLGIGDDAAALRFSGDVLATCDVQVEGVHFSRDLCGPRDIGWRALAVNLSDIAAMAGTPRFALVSLALPADTHAETVDGVYAGLGEAAAAHDVAVVGGNVSRTAGPFVIDVTLLGETNAPLRRSGARVGDGVWITGQVGKAAAGLYLARHGEVRVPGGGALVAAYRRPSPRVAVGQALGRCRRATALIDTSDGTASDLLHLAEASGVGARIDAARLPLPEGLVAAARAAGADPLTWALGGGEDYELLFTAGPEFEALAGDLARTTGVPVTRIGDVLPATGGRWVVLPDGGQAPLVASGWDHFG
jgi:thiamine-monophosphate kinase